MLVKSNREPLSVTDYHYHKGQDGGAAVSPRGSSAVIVMLRGVGVPASKQGNRCSTKDTCECERLPSAHSTWHVIGAMTWGSTVAKKVKIIFK